MLLSPCRPAVCLLALSLLLPMTALHASSRYTVTASEDLEYFDVSACFDEVMPRSLQAHDERAVERIQHIRLLVAGSSRALEAKGMRLALPAVKVPACVQYRVDLRDIGQQSWRSSWRTQDAIVLDPALWLWYPEVGNVDEAWRVDFHLPPGYDVSAPWKRLDSLTRGKVSYEIHERMSSSESRVAIGRFSIESIAIPGGRLHYALLPGEPAADVVALRQWVNRGARALASAYGRMPVPDVQLLVVPIGRGDEPVPWGEVQRGGGDAVHLYIDQRRPAEEFMADWVLVHELSHLLHPVMDAADRWLYEGIASYYQNVLRARVGLMKAAPAWDALHAGFERGIQGTPQGRSLAEVSETMMRDRSFMRVYWSGAAIALLADVQLRQQSQGTKSLDTALAAFADCCLPAARRWGGQELLQQLDRLTDTTVFMNLYRTYIHSDHFPDLEAVYRDLGLRPVSETRLRLDPLASGAAICAAIMASEEPRDQGRGTP